MQLYLVRHPEPSGSAGLCYGRTDVSVEPAALAAAAAAVRVHIPAAVLRRAAIYTSPASRCLLLARELAAPREPRIAGDLLEMHFGGWEGVSWDEVPRSELDAWTEDVWSYRAGGGESTAMVAARWRRWSAMLTGHAGPIVAVTHAGLIRVALAGAALAGTDRSSLGRLFEPAVPFASVHRIAVSQACAS
jgi:alpha-ribazole phosphatase